MGLTENIDGVIVGVKTLSVDTPKHVVTEVSKNPRHSALKNHLIAKAKEQQGQVVREYEKVAKANQNSNSKLVDGLGDHYKIPMKVYFQMRLLYGVDCWADPDFMKAFVRDNPGCRVKPRYDTKGNEIVRGY